jgi:uncharacterized small protein (DUF1192 family)
MPSAHLTLTPLAVAVALWSAGCAVRSPEVAAGTPDERRRQIALLDQEIANAEAELGLRPAPDRVLGVDAAGGQGDAEADNPPGTSWAQPPGAEPGGAAGGVVAPSPPPPAMAPMQPVPAQEPAQSPVTRRLEEATCHRICRSVSSICDASERICRLADELDDAWAQGRCESSTRSCANAERRAASSCGDC